MRVREWQGEAVFLYEVAPGAADRSYGIHVARLAGLPASAIARATEVLKSLESADGGKAARLARDLPLFAKARDEAPPPPAAAPSAALALLRETDADALSPRAALELVYRLKTLDDSAEG